jgi:3-methyladenine DNA glycosylase AlkD
MEGEMNESRSVGRARRMAARIERELRALPALNAVTARSVRRRYSRTLRQSEPDFVLSVAKAILDSTGRRWLAYELIRYHDGAFRSLTEDTLEELGRGINSWESVDTFARTLAGPAWLKGQVTDRLIRKWARSEDFWWRRAALVSTVALNVRSRGGTGDVARTLDVCRLLVRDREDMVVKAMSWALRELVVHDRSAVERFLTKHETVLAARVKREVRNKLRTGLKTPRSKGTRQANG